MSVMRGQVIDVFYCSFVNSVLYKVTHLEMRLYIIRLMSGTSTRPLKLVRFRTYYLSRVKVPENKDRQMVPICRMYIQFLVEVYQFSNAEKNSFTESQFFANLFLYSLNFP